MNVTCGPGHVGLLKGRVLTEISLWTVRTGSSRYSTRIPLILAELMSLLMVAMVSRPVGGVGGKNNGEGRELEKVTRTWSHGSRPRGRTPGRRDNAASLFTVEWRQILCGKGWDNQGCLVSGTLVFLGPDHERPWYNLGTQGHQQLMPPPPNEKVGVARVCSAPPPY